ncbi:MAG: DNA-processing protein DprA [Candidatus Faecousia sp.]|nr:DNA-processing protein DprA [Candidatus Faecousia sp.]
MLVHWIWLAHRPGVSDRMKAVLLEHFCDPEDIYFADTGAFDHVQELTPEARESLTDKNLAPSERILEDCCRLGLHILTYRDAAYPVRLKNIPDPPMVLYYKGQLPQLDGVPVIGVVGTRKASAYGMTAAKRMGYQIGKCGAVVVSGMAYGIDGMAMSGALSAGAATVGVLGNGADIVYPLSNRALFRDVERYGCLLSEFAPGQPPAKWTFPKRNRIISGLSCGVLVVEAPEVSGALITARQAAEQGRDVFVVPGNIDTPTCAGSNRLLREGAIMVSSGWEVLSEYQAIYPDKIRREDGASSLTAYPDEVRRAADEAEKAPPKVAQKPRIPDGTSDLKKKLEKKSIDKEPSAPYSDVSAASPQLTEEEQQVVSALRGGKRLVDDVVAQTGLTTGKLLTILTMLELKGVIRQLPGKWITLV